MFKNLIIKKNLVQKIYFRLLSLVLVIIVLSVGIFLYKTNFNRSSITIYDQSIPVSSNLDKLEVPKDLNPENSKTSEYNFSSPHLIILNNKKIGIADRVDLNQLGFESGINQLKISKVEKVFENLYKVGRPKIWEINIDKIKPEVKTTLPSKLIFQESDITLEIEVSEQGQLISKNLLSDQFLVSGKNQVKFQLTESNQKIDFEYRDLAGNTVSQNITLKNQLNSNLASLACPNFKFWYDKSRLINNWERLTYFDYKTATYPDSPLNTASLATYNILND